MQTITFDEYMAFFKKWLDYQFPLEEHEWHNLDALKKVSEIVSDPAELEHWANRDNWSMLDFIQNLPQW